MASNTTLSTHTAREKGIPPAIQVLGGWRVKVGGTNPRSGISKSVLCAISLPPFYASLLAEAVPGAFSRLRGHRTPCNATGSCEGSGGIADCRQNLLGKQSRP